MATLSYNETKNRQLELRHIFLPSAYGLVCEIIIGVSALIVFNLSTLSDQVLSKNFQTANPLSLWGPVIRRLLDKTQNHYGIQQILLFALWAVVGALVYVLAFRLIQLLFGLKHSVDSGVRFVQQDHTRGIFYWLASLHDLFIKIVIVILGGLALVLGSLVCFGIASQELADALAQNFPTNLESYALSLLGAIISVRLIALGISLLSRRFRNWYTA